MKLSLLIFLFLFCNSYNDPIISPIGIWVNTSNWEHAPKKIDSIETHAFGIVLRFCPDGKFRMVKCIIYRHNNHAGIGSSDGISIYEGNWINKNNKISVIYKLVDSEISFAGIEATMLHKSTVVPTLTDSSMQFAVVSLRDTSAYHNTTFMNISKLDYMLDDKFIECAKEN